VDLGAGLGDRFHERCVSGDVLRHVGDDRERRHRLQLVLRMSGEAARTAGQNGCRNGS
jgi:hypothetical protein